MAKDTDFTIRLEDLALDISDMFIERDGKLQPEELTRLIEVKNLFDRFINISEAKNEFEELKSIYLEIHDEGA